MSHQTGEPVPSIEYAIHHMAFRAGMLPWELEAQDPPADKFLQALSIDEADAEGKRRKAALDKWRSEARRS